MASTAWGNLEDLIEGERSGGGDRRETARRNQRERLMAAMVICCDGEGYEATSVADLLATAELSRGTFYEHFSDKLGCFVATVEEIGAGAIAILAARLEDEGSAEDQGFAALEAFVAMLVDQPAAARLCLVHSYAAGEAGLAPVRETVEAAVGLAGEGLRRMPGRGRIPAAPARAIIGGIHGVVYSRLQNGREAELPALLPSLWEWAMSYSAPPVESGAGRRHPPSPSGALPPFAVHDPEQRMIRAFAEVVAAKGYSAATVSDVAAVARVSQSTFYAHFSDKADVMAAALDSSGAQLVAAALPPARRAKDWATAVQVGLKSTCNFFTSEPAFAKLRLVGVYAAGPEAIALRDESSAALLDFLRTSIPADLRVNEVALEATVGAIYGTLYDRIRTQGSEDLLELLGLLTHLALAPWLKAEQATEIAAAK